MTETTIKIRRRKVATDVELDASRPALLNRIYLARNIRQESDLDYALKHLPPPDALKGMADAVELLADSLAKQARILVVGDFDADGATSTAVMMKGLAAMGALHVSYLVPDRFKFGYGLTPEIVEVAAQQNPGLIITVDNGIASIEGVAAAKEKGIQVLVTDHHLPGDELPAADAIVNPNQPGDTFPTKNIAGVGVAFYLLSALRKQLRNNGWFDKQGIKEPNLAELLDLVTLGTVADVVPLDQVNRTLVKQGLARINAGRCCPGITALIDVAGKQAGNLTASDLGFFVAPRLNAAGRIEDMSVGIECLLAEDPERANMIATDLDRLNRERRSIESKMKEQAMQVLRKLKLDADLPGGVCIFDESWHQGVIGILASRIKERYHRPVIAFAPAGEESGDGDELKGSARSIPGLHIRDALDAIATHHPGLITRFGGHAMAAGLSLPAASYGEFSQAFDEEVSRQLDADDLEKTLMTDGELSDVEMNMNTAMLLRNAGPWGQHFPEPVFEGEFNVVNRRIVGQNHLKMELSSGGTTLDAIMFNIREDFADRVRGRMTVVYKLDVNEFRGRRSVQLLVEHMKPAP
ncbi:MAG TPA: single-stranded-DNA-specific exonuclease RecJ [Gammaproteobacteria bacterium]|nr:single-stranded-DNA-specific exonuclease RecJ [Gammaproteobacteria bacterium]